MRIVDAELIPYQLPFTTPWETTAGRWHERRGWLIRITDQAGRSGHGDAAPLPASGTESLAQAHAWLKAQLALLVKEHPADACRRLPPPGSHPAARCGLETALLDLQSKQQARPLYELLGARAAGAIRVNASIGTLNDGSGERAALAIAAGFTTLKLKLGISPLESELPRLERLCEALPGDIRLRLDANRAWQAEEAIELVRKLNRLPIESLEEPLRHPTPGALRDLQSLTRFDLALDESLPGFLQGQRLRPLPVRRVVVKPACLGGPVVALDLIRQAHHCGVACLITSTLESSAGIWPLYHLAAAADALTTPAVHGLATSHWFSRDLGEPPAISSGQVTLGSESGTGFILGV